MMTVTTKMTYPNIAIRITFVFVNRNAENVAVAPATRTRNL